MAHHHDHDHLHDSHPAGPHDDAWFVHTADEPEHQAVHGRVHEGGIGLVLGLTLVGVLLVGIFFVDYVPRAINHLRVDRQERNPNYTKEIDAKRAAWAAAQTQPRWSWNADGTAVLDLDSAADAVVREYEATASGN